MKFSERAGLQPIKLDVQLNSMSPELRNRLWNVLHDRIWSSATYYAMSHHTNGPLQTLCLRLWNDHFEKPIDEIPKVSQQAIGEIRAFFFGCQWFEVYDFVEFISHGMGDDFTKASNRVMSEELSAYRFVAGKIAEITNERDVAAIEASIAQTASPFPTAALHLKAAVGLLARKPNPDYRNTIKESISAVEALCNTVTSDTHGTLGQALKVLDFPVHPALRLAFEKLYGYTSDADGIRHALMEEENLRQEDALFMLVACSAFVSYLVSKYARKKQP
jgi:AbiJ N-terminal domain 4